MRSNGFFHFSNGMCRYLNSEGREKPLWSVLFHSLHPQPIHFWDLNPWQPKVLSAVFYVLISCFSPCFHVKTAIDATGTTSTKLPTHVGKIINIFPLSAAHYGWYTLITDGIYGAPRPHTPPALAEASTGLCGRKAWWRREGEGKTRGEWRRGEREQREKTMEGKVEAEQRGERWGEWWRWQIIHVFFNQPGGYTKLMLDVNHLLNPLEIRSESSAWFKMWTWRPHHEVGHLLSCVFPGVESKCRRKKKPETSCDHLKYMAIIGTIKMDPVAANHFLKCVQVLIALTQHIVHSAEPKTTSFRRRKSLRTLN